MADRAHVGRVRVLRHRASLAGGVEPRSGRSAGLLERLAAELRRAQRRLASSSNNKIAFCFNALGCMDERMTKAAFLALLLIPASPAFARGATGFTLVNGTAGALTDVSIRRAGTNDWKPLGAGPAAGAGGPIKFSDPDCAFDIRANVAGGGPVT